MRTVQISLTIAVAAASLFVGGCAGPAAATVVSPAAGAPTPSGASPVPTAAVVVVTPAVPAGSPTSGIQLSNPTPVASAIVATPVASPASPAPAAQASSPALIHFDVVANGTTADYRVREQLARLSFPSDAVGTTTKVTGGLVIGTDGKIVPDQSKFVVDLTALKSDSGGRDGYIQGNTLQTATYPTAVFVPTETKGLAAPLPTAGKQTFQLVGNLTIHGVTRPATWDVTSQVAGNDLTGQATTDFTFEDFGMPVPKRAAVLSIKDDVKLELTFHLAKR